MIKQDNEEQFVVVSTKISLAAARVLDRICTAMRVDIYHLFQWFINTIIRMASPLHELSPSMQRLMALLESSVGWQKALNLCAPRNKLDIAQMILILQDDDKRGFSAVMLDKPFIDDVKQTECVDTIVERVLKVCVPGVHRRLMRLGREMDSNSIIETLVTMIDEQLEANIEKENAAEMQGENDYHDYGRRIEYGNRFIRHPNKDIEDLRQQMIQFTFDDCEQADEEVARAYTQNPDEPQPTTDEPEQLSTPIDFRPIGEEW